MSTQDVYEVLAARERSGYLRPPSIRCGLSCRKGFPSRRSRRSARPWRSAGRRCSRSSHHDRTLIRRKKESRLQASESDRLFRLARVAALALEVLEDADKARRWIHKPNRALGGEVRSISSRQTSDPARWKSCCTGSITGSFRDRGVANRSKQARSFRLLRGGRRRHGARWNHPGTALVYTAEASRWLSWSPRRARSGGCPSEFALRRALIRTM